MKILLALAILLMSYGVSAEAPTCFEYSPENYCRYTGKVEKVYVNDTNLILVYFDTPFSQGTPQDFGFNTIQYGAAALAINDNPTFAQYFYAAILAAQASGRDVTIQMRGVTAGYMKIDRIWLDKP